MGRLISISRHNAHLATLLEFKYFLIRIFCYRPHFGRQTAHSGHLADLFLGNDPGCAFTEVPCFDYARSDQPQDRHFADIESAPPLLQG